MDGRGRVVPGATTESNAWSGCRGNLSCRLWRLLNLDAGSSARRRVSFLCAAKEKKPKETPPADLVSLRETPLRFSPALALTQTHTPAGRSDTRSLLPMPAPMLGNVWMGLKSMPPIARFLRLQQNCLAHPADPIQRIKLELTESINASNVSEILLMDG